MNNRREMYLRLGYLTKSRKCRKIYLRNHQREVNKTAPPARTDNAAC